MTAGILYPFVGIRLTPMIAAVAMATSSRSVVLDANRMRSFSPPAFALHLPAVTTADGVEIGERGPTAVGEPS